MLITRVVFNDFISGFGHIVYKVLDILGRNKIYQRYKPFQKTVSNSSFELFWKC